MVNINFLIFLQIISLIVCAFCHLSSVIIGIKFYWRLYPITSIIVLIICLLAIYVMIPIANWLNVMI